MYDNQVLQSIDENRFRTDTVGQSIDAKLICRYLRVKYDNNELSGIINIIQDRISKCQSGDMSWFGYD